MGAANLTLAPEEGCGILVIGCSEITNRVDELIGTAEAGVAQGLALKDAEPNLDLIEPTGAGGREVEGHIWMRCQPVIVFLMRVEVVQNDVDLPIGGSVI